MQRHCRTLLRTAVIVKDLIPVYELQLQARRTFSSSLIHSRRSGDSISASIHRIVTTPKIEKGYFLANTSSSTSTVGLLKKMGDSHSHGLPDTAEVKRENKVKLTQEEWKKKLTPEQYSVCRAHGTEKAWTGELLENKATGVYQCTCCGADLFGSSTKFDSGSGWPSFHDVMKDADNTDLPAVDANSDHTRAMVRTEVLCGKCDSHLGHVFNDGPQPTGLRYCINSVSLKFENEKK